VRERIVGQLFLISFWLHLTVESSGVFSWSQICAWQGWQSRKLKLQKAASVSESRFESGPIFTSPEPLPVLRAGRACFFRFTISNLRLPKNIARTNQTSASASKSNPLAADMSPLHLNIARKIMSRFTSAATNSNRRRRGDETHFKPGFLIFNQSLLTSSPTIIGIKKRPPFSVFVFDFDATGRRPLCFNHSPFYFAGGVVTGGVGGVGSGVVWLSGGKVFRRNSSRQNVSARAFARRPGSQTRRTYGANNSPSVSSTASAVSESNLPSRLMSRVLSTARI